MKYIFGAFIILVPIVGIAETRVFYLEDLVDKLNGGMTSEQYCQEKANVTVAQAKASNAPIQAQVQLKQWIAIACNLDIIAEGKRISGK